uniref:FUN14 domain-containing protein 1 n=1 Tax=Strigamia maritima TaxID=126957 RepID=T1J703_STRMM
YFIWATGRGKDDFQIEKNEIIDYLDVRGRGGVDNSFKEYLRGLSKASAAKQAAVGGITGWLSGFVFTKVGKFAAVSIGGGLLLLQIANHQGYIRINWNKVNDHVQQARKEIEKEAKHSGPRIAKQVQRFIHENAIISTSFAGGFLLGIACS